MSAKYYIYRNLHKQDYFSIKLRGKVIDRQNIFVANNAEFRVSESGRLRALETNERNVHAFVVSDNYEVIELDCIDYKSLKEVTYNPFKLPSFIIKENNQRIKVADKVYFYNGKAFIK